MALGYTRQVVFQHQQQLLDWHGHTGQPKMTILVHGEEKAMATFGKLLKNTRGGDARTAPGINVLSILLQYKVELTLEIKSDPFSLAAATRWND